MLIQGQRRRVSRVLSPACMPQVLLLRRVQNCDADPVKRTMTPIQRPHAQSKYFVVFWLSQLKKTHRQMRKNLNLSWLRVCDGVI